MPKELAETDFSGAQTDSLSGGSTRRKELPTFEQFESELSPELERIHELLRPSFLFRAFELAKQKRKLEQFGEGLKRQTSEIRTSIAHHKKIRTQIRKAIKAIVTAEQAARSDDPELLKNLDVSRAKELLAGAEADLSWVISEMFPGWICPELRQKNEKTTKVRLPSPAKEAFPGLGIAKIDYWFIGELDKCLDIALPAKGKSGKIGRDRIIRRIFQVAFSERNEIPRIRKVRSRMRKRRNLEMKASK